MVGRHAVYDEAMLDTPHIDEAFKAQYEEKEWRVVIKRREALSTVTYPFNPLDAVGWHGDLVPVRLNVKDIRPLVSHRYHSAALGAHHLGRQPLRRLHVRAAPVRDRSGGAEGAVLPQQRRFRRGDLLP